MKALPLNALRALALVHATGGVRPAARELGIAHSAVSRHLASLERWLGTPLTRTERSGGRRGLVFTPQGEALARSVAAGLRGMAAAIVVLREAQTEWSVALAAPAAFARRWLLPRLPILEAAHPRIALAVVVRSGSVAAIGRGTDLAVYMGRGPWPDLDCEPLMDDFVYPVMSRAYWERAGRPTEPAELDKLRLLHDRDPAVSWDSWKHAFGPERLDVRRGPRFASTDLLFHAVEQGHGVALVRHRLAGESIDSGRLIRPIPVLQLELGYSYWLVRRAGEAVRPPQKAVIEWLRQQARRP